MPLEGYEKSDIVEEWRRFQRVLVDDADESIRCERKWGM